MIAPSWPKVVRPVADGKDVASCGLSIGLLLASFFQDRRHNGAPFAANTSADQRCSIDKRNHSLVM